MRTLPIHSSVAGRPGALVAVKDTSANGYHAVHAGRVCRRHLDLTGTAHTTDNLDAGDGPVHADAHRAGGGEV